MYDFNDVYKEYSNQVYRFLLSLSRNESLSEELTQETFYKALLHIGRFKGKCSLYAWLCQIAKNLYFNECKKNKKIVSDLNGIEVVSDQNFIHKAIEKNEAMYIHRILHKLKEPYKEVFTLKVFGELTFKEIAEIFGKSESWAKVTYYRAKEQLVKEMGDMK